MEVRKKVKSGKLAGLVGTEVKFQAEIIDQALEVLVLLAFQESLW